MEFEVGKWYKCLGWYLKYLKHGGSVLIASEHINSKGEYHLKESKFTTGNVKKILADIREIHEYLPENHPDKCRDSSGRVLKVFKPGEWYTNPLHSKIDKYCRIKSCTIKGDYHHTYFYNKIYFDAIADERWNITENIDFSQANDNLDQQMKKVDFPEKKSYEVVHCTNEKEWDFVREKTTSKYSREWEDTIVKNKNIDLALRSDGTGWAPLHYYKKINYLIFSFQEWCDKFGHENPFSKSTRISEFKKDDYIVYLEDYNNDGFNYNHCYKQRKNSNFLQPELTLSGSTDNGWQRISYDKNNWRYATKEEIAEYDRLGKPYNVNNLNNTIILNSSHKGKLVSLEYDNKFYKECLVVVKGTDIHLLNNCYTNADEHEDKSKYKYSLFFYDWKSLNSFCKNIRLLETKDQIVKTTNPSEKDWKPKCNDWVYIIKGGFGASKANDRIGKIIHESNTSNLNIKLINGSIWGFNKDECSIRKALPDEVEKALLSEAERRYPIDTKFYPAHSNIQKGRYCIITEDSHFEFIGGSIFSKINDLCFSSSLIYGTTISNRVIYDDTNGWAKIVESMEEKSLKSELTSLPEEWCIKPKNKEEARIIGKWFDENHSTTPFYEALAQINTYYTNVIVSGQVYHKEGTEITFEQFKKWVLKEDNKVDNESISIPRYVKCIEYFSNKRYDGIIFDTNKPTPDEITSSWKRILIERGRLKDGSFIISTEKEYIEQEKRKELKTPYKIKYDEKWIPRVGEYVVILKSDINWDYQMDSFVGKIVKISKVINDHLIEFENSGKWQWNLSQGHFRKATQEEIAHLYDIELSQLTKENFIKYTVSPVLKIDCFLPLEKPKEASLRLNKINDIY